jgi:hypothetical protein
MLIRRSDECPSTVFLSRPTELLQRAQTLRHAPDNWFATTAGKILRLGTHTRQF